MVKCYIGTSGYQYQLWKDSFYPKGSDPLQYYSKIFRTVEINYTFYKLPSKKTVKAWYLDTPANFKFSIKVNQYITHFKKLHNADKYIKKFLKRIKPLKDKLLCLLFQFPKNFSCTKENIKRILSLKKILPSKTDAKIALEFRHISWFNDDIYKIIKANKFIFVVSYVPKHFLDDVNQGFYPKLSGDVISHKNIYIRMHGITGEYVGSYSNKILNEVNRFIKKNKLKKAMVYFNNTDSVRKGDYPDAVKNAMFINKIC